MPRKATLAKWYTVTEAAQILGYSRANIWDLIKTGVFPTATKRGQVYLINASDIDKRRQYINDRRARAAERASRRANAAARAAEAAQNVDATTATA